MNNYFNMQIILAINFTGDLSARLPPVCSHPSPVCVAARRGAKNRITRKKIPAAAAPG